ncbi:MAG: peptide deformylase [Clostridia bacterium]|nr:peptide deformylase [Clostridia bacterium]
MAIRKIVLKGDEILTKKARVVDVINNRIIDLLEDMAETMHENNGVGLAAPQVGILKRVVVVDVGDGVIELINPEIIETSGEVLDEEGCLSVPGILGEVKRPKTVKVKALNRKGEAIEIEGSDLLARAFCHEIDHLNGVLFDERADKIVYTE